MLYRLSTDDAIWHLKKKKCSCSTWRGERGGGGAFRLRGVVPPCTDEAPEGTWGGCVGVCREDHIQAEVKLNLKWKSGGN